MEKKGSFKGEKKEKLIKVNEEKLLKEIDKVERRLTKKIEANTNEIRSIEKRLNGEIKKLDRKIESEVKRLDEKINNIGAEVIKHSLMLEEIKKNMVTKEIYNVLDEMVVILRRLDQERVFTSEWIRRIESDVEKNKIDIEKNKEDIKKIKEKIGMREES